MVPWFPFFLSISSDSFPQLFLLSILFLSIGLPSMLLLLCHYAPEAGQGSHVLLSLVIHQQGKPPAGFLLRVVAAAWLHTFKSVRCMSG